ncbi:Hachiman antiphage defense system protein HamA [Janthinobacterium sp. GMG2]|uniref:Hachiman antiphage defense system protein HamA n=1 Tax=Janthinobacterium sp. GMG2 TaxID=3096606 RepID=UPI0029F47399|nr:Hachiman antiphage defense system protein HamA [Janthinobacterium sp. GMG2]MDX8122181.1 Hachiman antiphage defense system protein HamA [Janthinobacterium sp. GMG2]
MLDSAAAVTTACGQAVKIYDFSYELGDAVTISAWAKHFRNHYCDDNEIDSLCVPMNISRKEYLETYKFPVRKALQKGQKTGPATRAGDFAEILVSDFLTYRLQYWVPKVRYAFKINPNSSDQGSDVVGMRLVQLGAEKDELIVYEVKAKFTGSPVNRLQDAVDHSDKDKYRLAESLNAIRQRLKYTGNSAESEKVIRFQNPDDNPYPLRYGAAAVVAQTVFDVNKLALTSTLMHKNRDKLDLMIIHGPDMMNIVHHLYEKAADEA